MCIGHEHAMSRSAVNSVDVRLLHLRAQRKNTHTKHFCAGTVTQDTKPYPQSMGKRSSGFCKHSTRTNTAMNEDLQGRILHVGHVPGSRAIVMSQDL